MIRRCSICNKKFDGALLSCPDCGVFPGENAENGIASSGIKDISSQVKKEVYKSITVWFLLVFVSFALGLVAIYIVSLSKIENAINEKINREVEGKRIESAIVEIASVEVQMAVSKYVENELQKINNSIILDVEELIDSIEITKSSIFSLQDVISELEGSAVEIFELILENPNFEKELYSILTGFTYSIFFQYKKAMYEYEKSNYDESFKLITKVINEYEDGYPWDLQGHSERFFNNQVGNFYTLAAKVCGQVGKYELSYDYSLEVLNYSPTYFSYYIAAVSAYNNGLYGQSLELVEQSLVLDPPEYFLPLYQDLKGKSTEKLQQ